MERKLTILDPYYSDRAAISGGAWATSLAYLQDMQPTRAAQSSSASPTDTKIVIDFGEPRPIDSLALGRHNLSATAMVRILAAPDAYDLAVMPWWDSGWLSVWPDTGKPTDRGVTWYDLLKFFAASMAFRWWRIEIDDSANTAGYVQIGRLYMGAMWQPTYNYSFGWERSRTALDVRIDTPSGHTLTDKRSTARTWTLPLDFISRDDADDYLDDFDRLIGTAKDFFVCLDPTETARLHRKMMMATLSEMPSRTQPLFELFRATLKLKELR